MISSGEKSFIQQSQGAVDLFLSFSVRECFATSVANGNDQCSLNFHVNSICRFSYDKVIVCCGPTW